MTEGGVFAVTVRVSPLELGASLVAHGIIAGLLLNLLQPVYLVLPLLLILAASMTASVWWYLSLRSSRIRRFIIADSWSLLLPQPGGVAPVKHAPPVPLRCGEFLIILKFPALASASGGLRAKVVRLWPGTLSRADASRLRRALRAEARES